MLLRHCKSVISLPTAAPSTVQALNIQTQQPVGVTIILEETWTQAKS